MQYDRGLTLIELLVALSVLGIVTVVSYRGIDSVRRTDQGLAEVAGRWEAVTSFLDRFQSDVLQISPRAWHTPEGGLEPAWRGRQAGDGNAYLDLSRKPVARGLNEERVGYRLRNGTVELMIWPPAGGASSTAPRAYPLLRGVAAFELNYLANDDNWVSVWPTDTDSNSRHPRGVRMQLRLSDGTDIFRTFALP